MLIYIGVVWCHRRESATWLDDTEQNRTNQQDSVLDGPVCDIFCEQCLIVRAASKLWMRCASSE